MSNWVLLSLFVFMLLAPCVIDLSGFWKRDFESDEKSTPLELEAASAWQPVELPQVPAAAVPIAAPAFIPTATPRQETAAPAIEPPTPIAAPEVRVGLQLLAYLAEEEARLTHEAAECALALAHDARARAATARVRAAAEAADAAAREAAAAMAAAQAAYDRVLIAETASIREALRANEAERRAA